MFRMEALAALCTYITHRGKLVLGAKKLLPAAGRNDQIEENRDWFLETRRKCLSDGS
jgi:hypothetical protein